MMDPSAPDPRRQLPSVDRLLREPDLEPFLALYGRERVRVQARCELERIRERALAGEPTEREIALAEVVERIGVGLRRELGGGARRVLNATGIFLHTNLGRAPLPREVATTLPELLDAYCDLEMDLETGRRGNRNELVEPLLRAVTGAPAALVVNNNAGALLLAVAALAAGGEVVVSRGELVEIGGSFRIPEILATAGARLVEVGTTNRTHPRDYAEAVGPETRLLLKIFPSNYRIQGFVRSVAARELVPLSRESGVPLLVDEGSGLLRPHPAPQLRSHPSLSELIADGCSLVAGSGDKLLGGPQAGLLLGEGELVDRCRRHPLYRPLRPDRATFATLAGILRHHLAGEPLPLDRMWLDGKRHRERLASVAAALGGEIVAADAFLGGGAAPEAPIPGEAIALPGDDALLRRLRTGEPSVVGYLREDRLYLDLRTVDPRDDPSLLCAVREALEG